MTWTGLGIEEVMGIDYVRWENEWIGFGNTYFKHKSLHKYTRVAKGQDRGEEKRMIDLVKKDMLHYVQDVMVVRGMGRSLSDHNVILCKVKLVGALRKRREVVDGARRTRIERLRKHQYR